jgi:hypothetical protein
MGYLEEQLVRVDEAFERALAGEERLGVHEFLVVGRGVGHAITIPAVFEEDSRAEGTAVDPMGNIYGVESLPERRQEIPEDTVAGC